MTGTRLYDPPRNGEGDRSAEPSGGGGPRILQAPIREEYEKEGSPWHATARLWDDGIIDPVQTRDVLGLAFAVTLNAPIPDRPQFGVFRM